MTCRNMGDSEPAASLKSSPWHDISWKFSCLELSGQLTVSSAASRLSSPQQLLLGFWNGVLWGSQTSQSDSSGPRTKLEGPVLILLIILLTLNSTVPICLFLHSSFHTAQQFVVLRLPVLSFSAMCKSLSSTCGKWGKKEMRP